MKIITTTPELAAFCARLAQEPFVALDTEFMRDQTYWAKLCLIQAAGRDEAAIIDPLAPGIDLAPFWELLRAPSTVKVFHAARQDIEIFHTQGKVLPSPMFDTQIAAMVCGYGEAASYESLVRQICKGTIDKTHRFTDWARRPLSERQLAYALDDVTYLRDVYRSLQARLDKTGRMAWVAEEMGALISAETYELDPEESWRRFKLRSGSKKMLAVLKAIAAWREREAQARDVPRGRILKDDAVLDVASHAPATAEAIEHVRSIPKGYAQSRAGQSLLEAIKRGLAMKPEEIPQLDRDDRARDADPGLTDMLKVLLRLKSDEHHVAARLVASASDVELLAADDKADIPAMHGWRHEIFGSDALKLKRGELALVAENGRLKVLAREKV